LPDILEVPQGNLVLVSGAPGSGKSAFLNRLLAHHLFDLKKPAIFVSTKSPAGAVKRNLERIDRTAARLESVRLATVDAYSATVGLRRNADQTGEASCGDPTSIGIALGKALRDLDGQDVLIGIESLTPIYLLNDKIFIKFVQNTLLRYAAENHGVVATIDEGCGRSEDLTALTAMAPVVLRMRLEETRHILEILKHPNLQSRKLVVGSAEGQARPILCRSELTRDTETLGSHWQSGIRPNLGDYVGIPWLQLVSLGGLMWDYRRFPRMIYEVSRDVYTHCVIQSRELRTKQGTEDPKKERPPIHDPEVVAPLYARVCARAQAQKWAMVEFQLDRSTKERHVFLSRENALCWNIGNLGAHLCFYDCGSWAGAMRAWDSDGCEWSAYEEKCMAAGSPYCEFVASPDVSSQLSPYLDSCQSSNCEDVLNELIGTVAYIGLKGVPPSGRPHLGGETHFSFFQETTSVPALSNEKFMLAVRLAGANVGKRLAEKFLKAGAKEDRAHAALASIFAKLKVGRFVLGDTVRLYENCESQGIKLREPICFFTTGFLNSFFNTVDGFKVKELKCSGAGDQFCEWEFL
jgi:predicted hydrocarbon binding protein/KaiC/GvpD/RAD55 family RecA-like ATPase